MVSASTRGSMLLVVLLVAPSISAGKRPFTVADSIAVTQITYASAALLRPLSLYMGATGPVSSRTLYAKRQRSNVFRKCF